MLKTSKLIIALCSFWLAAVGCAMEATDTAVDEQAQASQEIRSLCNNNGVCEFWEHCSTCFYDCDGDANCCGNNLCEQGTEDTDSCPEDCPPACGNGSCQSGENRLNCPEDCERCGDGVCTVEEWKQDTCYADCGCSAGRRWCSRLGKCVPTCSGSCRMLSIDGSRCISYCRAGQTCSGGSCCSGLTCSSPLILDICD